MHLSDYSSLVNIIPPALVIAILGYFSQFFGKIIADQKPFSDNREWEIELGGVIFIMLLVQGLVGAGAAIYGAHLLSSLHIHVHLLSYEHMHAVDTFVLFIIYCIIALANGALSAVFYKLDAGVFRPELRYRTATARFFYAVGKRIPISLVPVVLFYIATVEYLSGSIIWIILTWSSILYILIQLAFNFSLRKLEDRVPVDIHFVGETQEPLENVLILKVNDDNIRLRVDDSIVIVNKDQVLKIVMAIPEKDLDRSEKQEKNAG